MLLSWVLWRVAILVSFRQVHGWLYHTIALLPASLGVHCIGTVLTGCMFFIHMLPDLVVLSPTGGPLSCFFFFIDLGIYTVVYLTLSLLCMCQLGFFLVIFSLHIYRCYMAICSLPYVSRIRLLVGQRFLHHLVPWFPSLLLGFFSPAHSWRSVSIPVLDLALFTLHITSCVFQAYFLYGDSCLRTLFMFVFYDISNDLPSGFLCCVYCDMFL